MKIDVEKLEQIVVDLPIYSSLKFNIYSDDAGISNDGKKILSILFATKKFIWNVFIAKQITHST